jgi:hypothetical protein
MITLLLIEDRGKNGDRQQFSAPADSLLRNACEAADLILTSCRQLAWDNSDLDRLGRLREEISC